ncbi:MAG TPA: hypothetical protein VGQ21_19310 [Thermoanaerobaculia bacterium]|jgi:hypothetical protein|nr:hypothetical protein [Thermoanaerobaculia bacterium]
MTELPHSPERPLPDSFETADTTAGSQTEGGFVTGRKALITTLVSLALSPFAIVTGYYLSKLLAAPRLTVQYVRADADREPLKLHDDVMKSLKADLSLHDTVYSRLSSPCDKWLENNTGEVPKTCLSDSLNVAAQLVDAFTFQQKLLNENIALIQACTPDKPLVLNTLALAGGDLQKLTELARQDKARAAELFGGPLKALEMRLSALTLLLADLHRLEQMQNTPRTGKVTFRVGILNNGDADGVVFPDASVIVIDTNVPLIRRASADDKTGKYTVIKAHSFEEVPFEVNDAKTEKDAFAKWQGLIKKETQEKFSITLRSPKDLSADGRLPE